MRRRTPLLILVGAVVVVVLWFLVVFQPKGDDLTKAKDRRDTAQRQTQSLKAQLAQLQGLQAERPALEAERSRYDAAIPPTPDLAGLILSLNQIAVTSGVDWVSVAPSPPAASTGANAPSTVGLAIQIRGGFFQTLDYLNRLEGLPRLVVVDSTSITAAASETGVVNLTATVTGRAFTRQAAAGTATTTTTTAPGATTTTTAPGGTTTTTRSGSAAGVR